MATKVADDYAFIAARMREIEAEKCRAQDREAYTHTAECMQPAPQGSLAPWQQLIPQPVPNLAPMQTLTLCSVCGGTGQKHNSHGNVIGRCFRCAGKGYT